MFSPLRPSFSSYGSSDCSVVDNSIIDYELDEQKNDSNLRIMWSKVMDQGPYKNLSTYGKVVALFLCWAENFDDLATADEVNRLKSVLEEQFYYHVQVKFLDNYIETKVQVLLNRIVAEFVYEHHGPNTLLIVYYAGHGRPGSYYGQLELFGKISPLDQKKCMDSLVWNKTEALLNEASSDVLAIFDCCYPGNLEPYAGNLEQNAGNLEQNAGNLEQNAGNLGRTRWDHRSFEYLAANQMGSTPVPGESSFTSALIFALEDLLKKKDGRFTTDELLRKIQHEAPNFPRGRTPVLLIREEGSTSASCIMLHPLDRNGTRAQSPSKERPSLDPTERQILTLHFYYSERPSDASIEMLGFQLNHLFSRNTLGVNRVHLGSLRSSMFDPFKSFTASLGSSRRTSVKQQRPPVDTLFPVPRSPHGQFSSAQPSTAPRDEKINTENSTVGVAPVSPLSDESEDQNLHRCKKRRLSL